MACSAGLGRCILNDVTDVAVDPLTGDLTAASSKISLDILGFEATQRIKREGELSIETLIQTGLALAQMALYYSLADDMIDKRDEKIDDEKEFIEELQEYTETQDLPILQLKRQSVNLGIPGANPCGEAGRYLSEGMQDGEAVVETCQNFSRQSCAGIPNGWGIHEGELKGAMGAAYASGILSGNTKRREERFRKHKTDIVRTGQQGMKAVYNANDILTKYSQASSIYAGLADLFIQGFNSAGAALGVAMGKLSGNTGTSLNSQGGVSTGATQPTGASPSTSPMMSDS